jgi:preprotein translocase subunit SecG
VYTLLIVIHVFICLGLIMVILMQSSKGEGLAGAFGGTSLTGAVFGGRGAATFLSKATSVMAVAFMLSCLGLAFISPARQSTRQESAVKKELQNTQPIGTDDQGTALPGEGSSNQEMELPPAPTGDNQESPAQGQ